MPDAATPGADAGIVDFTNTPWRCHMSTRSEALAQRLEQGARELATLAQSLSDEQWQTRLPHDGRKIGVVVHHVGTMYPIEIQLAQNMAAGQPVAGVTWAAVHEMNAKHASDFDGTSKAEALDLLERNSAAAAAAVRAFSDEELDRVVSLSLNNDDIRSCQFMLEDHAVGHAWHHLKGIRAALG
jgi:hypothetical protein